jgi:transcriptional regulator with XRE-family HTH domain
MATRFGEFLKERRTERRLTLRAFCNATGYDPANYSKLERGLLAPPKDPERLDVFREALAIPRESEAYREMLRLAALDRGEIPVTILSNEALLGKLPVFFRTLEGDPVNEAALDELIQTLRREYQPGVTQDPLAEE